jgi:hypothetical protein
MFAFNRPTLQYVRNGRPVAAQIVKAAADAASNQSRFSLFDAASKMARGEMDVPAWIVEHDRGLKVLHGVESALGRGGFDQMTPADWGKAADRVANQYGYSRAFAEEVAAGKYGKPGSLDFSERGVLARVQQYANAGRCTYENAVTDNAKDRLGHTYAARVLANVSHCGDCEDVAARGWIEISSYPEIGSDQCRSNCACVTVTTSDPNDPI